ncbi:serine hydrolase domain-containing protein [Henriciella marina]|uniref:serine hydrolase domain-containing protein n=1 Tax=Henriciella marina TaxID=453851 RepID=UPI000A04ECD0|nr:serine hydrolase [Henriciella marina]
MRILPAITIVIFAGCGAPSEPSTSNAQPASVSERSALVAPDTSGLNEQTIEATLEAAEGLPQLRSLIVMRDGEVLVEERFNGGPPLDRGVNIKSASKSVMSALVGIAIHKGVLTGVDQTVLSVLEADAPADPDPMLSEVTVGHLLSMQSGLERTSGANYGRWVVSDNWVRHALSRPFVDEPGGRMLYSTGNTHLLSAMLTSASGRDTYQLAEDWLTEPLGISIPSWQTDPQGIYFGGNNMSMSPRDMAAFGELYRLGGVVDGQRVLSEDWIEESWTPRTVSPWSGEQYGYGWFISDAGGFPVRYAWGYGGQMIYVLPDLGLTVVITSDTGSERGSSHIRELHELLEEGIVPAAVDGG